MPKAQLYHFSHLEYNTMNLALARTYILERLTKELSPTFSYHHVNHTLAVAKRAQEIALSEGISDEESLVLLATACYFHDSGFLVSYDNHEDFSCQIVEEILPSYGYNAAQISVIKNLIKATKIPQSPDNLLSKILCDADLDYLGGANYYTIVETLHQELLYFERLNSNQNWTQIQIDFLEKHSYFTSTNQKERTEEKNRRIEELRLSQDTSKG